MSTFKEILAHRGRVVVFTPNAAVGLTFEQYAERAHAQVICTRGWADPYGPIGLWHRACAAREYAVLSCDQHRYVTGFRIPATDLVWVGNTGSLHVDSHIFQRYSQAMNRSYDLADTGLELRRWAIGEGDLE